jgi:hypothetical protein
MPWIGRHAAGPVPDRVTDCDRPCRAVAAGGSVGYFQPHRLAAALLEPLGLPRSNVLETRRSFGLRIGWAAPVAARRGALEQALAARR